MTYTAEYFNQFCHQAAVQFLQTVVVIDNEAIFCETPCSMVEQRDIAQGIEEPPTGVLGGQRIPALGKTDVIEPPSVELAGDEGIDTEPPDELSKNILKAAPLINAFADNGVICSVIRPDLKDEKVVDRAIAVASVADIVVVDWALGKKQGETEGQRAKEIIKGIIENDLKKRGRLRLIAIYTAENIPGNILDELYNYIQVFKYFKDHDELLKDSKKFTIQNRSLKIAVLLKKAAGNHVPNIRPVDFDELPEKLHELFAGLNCGLLPSVTLRAIAAIREGTHHLLAVLHKDLDSALVGHRTLLPHPEDAEGFCEDLVSDEIRSILALKKIGNTYAGESANKQWIGSKIEQKEPLEYNSFHLTRAHAFALVEKGEGAHKKIFNELRTDWLARKLESDPGFKDKTGSEVNIETARAEIFDVGDVACKKYRIPDIGEKMIPQMLKGNEVQGQQANLDFSRLCSLKREAFGLRRPVEGWIPRLTLGTILQLRDSDGDRFFLCLQPRCDSVRLEKDKVWNFPFLVLEKASSKLNIVAKCFDKEDKPTDKKLFYEPKPRNQVVFGFTSITEDAIEASEQGGKFIFQDKENNKFFWIADLKDSMAQKIADELSARVGSVGLDEYEWLRRKAR